MLTFGLAIHPNTCAALTFWFLKRKQSSWSWCQDVIGQLTIQGQGLWLLCLASEGPLLQLCVWMKGSLCLIPACLQLSRVRALGGATSQAVKICY